MANDFLPGTLSTRSAMRSTLAGSKVLANKRVKTFCIVKAIGNPSGESESPGAKVFSICTAAWPCKRISPERCSVVQGHARSEEHTSELQSHSDLVCRL